MKNHICTGEKIVVTAPVGGLTSGAPYLVGSKLGVVFSGGLEGAECVVFTEGVFEIAKAAGAVTIGQKLYWDAANAVLTTVVTDFTYAGYAFKASLAGDANAFLTLVDNPGAPIAAKVVAIATVNGSDLATTQALANATKVTVNEILVALKAAGLMATA